MNPQVIVLRPEPGGHATVVAARELGLETWGFPLFTVMPLAWQPPPPDTVDALLIGSSNVLRHGGPALALYQDKPAYVVGQATAEAARATGLAIAGIGSGGLGAVMGLLAPSHRRLLRLAGRDRIDLVPPDGVTIIEHTVYGSDPQPLTRELARLLTTHALGQCIVLLHSGEAARHFAAECDRLGIARGRIEIATLGPRIAAAAGEGWAGVAVAGQPDDAALLALARQLCQNGR